MQALAVKPTMRSHVMVLKLMAAHLKNLLTKAEWKRLVGAIDDYRRELLPLIVPVTLIKHYATVHQFASLQRQVYLNPHPKELMLRNRT
jgi:uncharacterized protein YbgA (DUF1722 family)